MAAPILGDLLYRAASLWTRLAGNTTTTRKFLSQTGSGAASAAPAWNQVADADLSVTDITTNNVTISAHGFTPKLPNDASKYLDGTGAYTVPGPGGGSVSTTGSPATGNLTKFSGATTITNADLTGDVTTAGTVATAIANNAVTTVKILNANVTLAKMANAAANSVLVGSGATGSGAAYTEVALGAGLSMTGTTLSVSVAASFFTVSVTLNHTQISGLGSTPVDLVAAPAAGLVIRPVAFYASSDCAAGAYNNPTIRFRYAGDTTDLVTGSTNTLNNTTKRIQAFPILAVGLSTSVASGVAIQVSASIGVTGGNAANQYRITTVYYVDTVL